MKPTEEKIQSNTSDLPVYLFKQGNNCEAYRYFGAHLETRVGESGVVFRVWAPQPSVLWATSTAGSPAATPCTRWMAIPCGNCSFPA